MKTLAISVLAAFVLLSGCAAADAADEDTRETSEAIDTLEYDEALPGAPTGSCYAESRTYWGRGCFIPNGDKFWVRDSLSDGSGVAIYWTAAGRHGICRSVLGAGVDGHCDKNLPEGRRIMIAIGRCDKTGSRTCRKASDYVWTDWDHWGT